EVAAATSLEWRTGKAHGHGDVRCSRWACSRVACGADGLQTHFPTGAFAIWLRARMTDFSPRRDVHAISHINLVLDDIQVATEFYGTVLGFDQAVNADGPMNYPGVDLASFARNAGFGDDRVSLDIRFLKHAEVGLHLELFNYRHPKGEQTVHRRKTNDLGG